MGLYLAKQTADSLGIQIEIPEDYTEGFEIVFRFCKVLTPKISILKRCHIGIFPKSQNKMGWIGKAAFKPDLLDTQGGCGQQFF